MQKLFKRELYLQKIRGFYHDCQIIKVLTGVRRCGKSSIMALIAEELKTDGINPNQIIYLDLDKRGNRKIKTADQLDALIESSVAAAPNGIKYLFIDEIQNVKDFEEVINGWREEEDFSIFITGSNSYLLSGELATKLTGRYIEFEIFPLSFQEYLAMKRFYSREIKPNDLEELNQYILDGGFPGALQYADSEDKRTYVVGIINEIFQKDIRRRVQIRNKAAFDRVTAFIINNFGATTSLTNIKKALEEDGMRIARETLNAYIQTLLDAKILYECSRFDLKSKKSLMGEKKYYLADTAFYFALNTDNRINYGPVLENMVFIYAKSRGYHISVGRIGKVECDFILRSRDQNYAYVQVAYTILDSKKTEDREYKSLEGIKDNYPKYVLTTDYILQNRNGIKHLNLLDFVKNGQVF
ncbi:MAG: ATP-binding protein [Lachnospiraceae bacterium]|nr:ATP-binding protein [Lachnospiraceae bacterium]